VEIGKLGEALRLTEWRRLNRFYVLHFRLFVQRRQRKLCLGTLKQTVLLVHKVLRFRLLFRRTYALVWSLSTDRIPPSQHVSDDYDYDDQLHTLYNFNGVLTESPKVTSDCRSTTNSSSRDSDNSDLLSCYVVNARSLKKTNALQLLQTEINSCMCDVAAVTETWLSKTVDSNVTKMDGYTLYRSDRPCRRGGGIAL